MMLAFAFLSFITTGIGLIFAYIVSYNVVITVEPDYLGLWWCSLWLMMIGAIFKICCKSVE